MSDMTTVSLKKAQGAQTRSAIIDATIHCLVESGYARTNPVRVAELANLTRGAVLHHFDNRHDLIRATIIELHDRRLKALARLDKRGRSQAGEIMRILWKQMSSDAAIASQELKNAARTDDELAAILFPVEKEFESQWEVKAEEVFDDWQKNRLSYKVATVIAQTVIEGLSYRKRSKQIDDNLIEATLSQLEKVMFDLYPSLED